MRTKIYGRISSAFGYSTIPDGAYSRCRYVSYTKVAFETEPPEFCSGPEQAMTVERNIFLASSTMRPWMNRVRSKLTRWERWGAYCKQLQENGRSSCCGGRERGQSMRVNRTTTVLLRLCSQRSPRRMKVRLPN